MRVLRNLLPALLIPLLLSALPVAAVEAPELSCVVNSAAVPSGTVKVNCDCHILPMAPGADLELALFYSSNGQQSWTEHAMSPVGLPGFDSTWATMVTAPGSGAGYYYISARAGRNFATGAPRNDANAWPPGGNLLASCASEPTGDTLNDPNGPWLDLTGCRVGWSGDRFYGMLTNNHNSWPTGSFPGPWYVYSIGFRNPAAPSDSYAFVMSYANVLGLYTSALYEINQLTEEYAVIGDVDVSTNGNRLYLRCRVADLVARPRFGPWPNERGCLTKLQGSTQSVTLSQNHYNHDTTDLCRFYAARLPVFTVGQNQSPLLSRPRVVPQSGTPETEFWFNVQYSDPDSNLPVIRRVVVDGADTVHLKPANHRYWTNVSYDGYRSGFAPGPHEALFVFHDGVAEATAVDTFRVDDTTGIAEIAGTPVSRLSAAPNPFGHAVTLSGLVRNVPARVLTTTGRLVRRFATKGTRWTWDGRDGSGAHVPPGIYFVRQSGTPAGHLRVIRAQR